MTQMPPWWTGEDPPHWKDVMDWVYARRASNGRHKLVLVATALLSLDGSWVGVDAIAALTKPMSNKAIGKALDALVDQQFAETNGDGFRANIPQHLRIWGTWS